MEQDRPKKRKGPFGLSPLGLAIAAACLVLVGLAAGVALDLATRPPSYGPPKMAAPVPRRDVPPPIVRNLPAAEEEVPAPSILDQTPARIAAPNSPPEPAPAPVEVKPPQAEVKPPQAEIKTPSPIASYAVPSP